MILLVLFAFALDAREVALGFPVGNHLSRMRVFLLILHFQRVPISLFLFFFEFMFFVLKTNHFLWVMLSWLLRSMLSHLVIVLAEDGVLEGFNLVSE